MKQPEPQLPPLQMSPVPQLVPSATPVHTEVLVAGSHAWHTLLGLGAPLMYLVPAMSHSRPASGALASDALLEADALLDIDALLDPASLLDAEELVDPALPWDAEPLWDAEALVLASFFELDALALDEPDVFPAPLSTPPSPLRSVRLPVSRIAVHPASNPTERAPTTTLTSVRSARLIRSSPRRPSRRRSK
jgi:hypothetical protein